MNTCKINYKRLIIPILTWAAGLMLFIVSAPETSYVNDMAALGIFVMSIGTFRTLYILCKEYDKTGKECPFFLEKFFSNYPIVEDEDELMGRLSDFRRSYSSFLSSGREEENSPLQNTASQLMWHSTALQKKRLMKKNLTIEMDSVRRAYSDRQNCVRENQYFDGRYMVNDIYEEISALRTIRRDGKIIKLIKDSEVAHFTLLSAKQTGEDQVICPNCGNATSRENLLDGCDYCGTRFTVEDMENRVDSFGLRHDICTNASKKEAARKTIFPWIYLATMLPVFYFGMLEMFYVEDFNIFLKLASGLFAGALLALVPWCLVSLFLNIMIPFGLINLFISDSQRKKMIYSRKKEEEQERRMADLVRRNDPFFSIQSFFGGIQNKLSAIHYAESTAEINAFSENDMSSYVEKYKDVVDIDFQNIKMESYDVNEKLQTATVSAQLRLLESRGDKIRERAEKLKMTMVKDAGCKTQAVCGASVLKCSRCGASLSLMEGKMCRYCGSNLNYKLYDWEITDYEIVSDG